MFYGKLFQHVLVSCHASFRDAEDDGFELLSIGFDAKKLVSHSACNLCIFSEGKLFILAEDVRKGDGRELVIHGCFQRGLIASF